MNQIQADPLIDILSRQTSYVHFSLPDAHTLIYDVSGCDLIATAPNPDQTLNAWQGQTFVILQPIKPSS